MTDSPEHDGAGPTEPPANRYTGHPDPAYAGQSPYAPPYGATNPTVPLPPYPPDPAGYYGAGQYSTDPYGQHRSTELAQDPPPPRSPRWLWLLAAASVIAVVGLLIALVIANGPSKQQTVVAPLPAMTEPSFTTPAPTPTEAAPSTTALPFPTPETPSVSPTPGDTEPVVYEVTGSGRAINITYVDSGNMMQTEFNVVLPWSREVDLPKPAQDSASVTVINVGRDVTCTVTISGVQVRERTGVGLTICTGFG